MLGDRSLRNYDLEDADDFIDDPLVFLAQPDSLIVTKTFADSEAAGAEQPHPHAHHGRRSGLHRARRYEARRAGERFRRRSGDHGHLRRAKGIRPRTEIRPHRYRASKTASRWTRRIGEIAGAARAGFQMEPPSSRGQQFEATSRIYALASNITSLFALFIGMFIIYNTFAIAVTQRRSEIGILRALGAMRRQIRTLFLVESALTGPGGDAAGRPVRIADGARHGGLHRRFAGRVSMAWRRAPAHITVDPRLVAAAIAMGLLTSLVAAVIPAQSAAAASIR